MIYYIQKEGRKTHQTGREGKRMDWDKAERLATIMYEEDKENYENGRPLVYYTEEDFKAEQAEREGKSE